MLCILPPLYFLYIILEFSCVFMPSFSFKQVHKYVFPSPPFCYTFFHLYPPPISLIDSLPRPPFFWRLILVILSVLSLI